MPGNTPGLLVAFIPNQIAMTPEEFLSDYDPHITEMAMKLREVLHANLPEIIEQVDLPAKMIGYCYSQKYADLICALFPSKKGLKLSFNRGTKLPDPDNLLEGTGKISRYLVIKSEMLIDSPAMKALLKEAISVWKKEKEHLHN
jgi:hypothetical protein